jgi:hypothetical protein
LPRAVTVLMRGALICACPALAQATEFIFDTVFVSDDASLREASSLEDAAADLRVRFRLVEHPGYPARLSAAVSRMEQAGYHYYITAAAVDFGIGNFYWDAATICDHLKSDRNLEGLYIHEIISGEVGASKRPFSEWDWSQIRAFAACAQTSHKRLLWSEWAGGSWGWNTFLRQASTPSSLAHRTLSDYRDVFVFLWANNRDARKASDQRDMQNARAAVEALGNPSNPKLPQGLMNPVQATFPYGISIQDWYWYESNRKADGSVDPGVMAQLPASMVPQFGTPEFAKGARYFQFEAYWSGQDTNSAGVYYPGFFDGIKVLRTQIVCQSRRCPDAPDALRAN